MTIFADNLLKAAVTHFGDSRVFRSGQHLLRFTYSMDSWPQQSRGFKGYSLREKEVKGMQGDLNGPICSLEFVSTDYTISYQ